MRKIIAGLIAAAMSVGIAQAASKNDKPAPAKTTKQKQKDAQDALKKKNPSGTQPTDPNAKH